MTKKVKIIFSPEAEEIYHYLHREASSSKRERMILRALLMKIEFIKANYHYGEPIAKNLIPQDYQAKYDATNLFRVELPAFWRMLYTLVDGEIEIIAFVLDVVDHDVYNKKFGYKKK